MASSELRHGRNLKLSFIMPSDLVKRENHRLSLDAIFIPGGFHPWREDAYSDAGVPDGVLSGAELGPENSLGIGC